MAWNESTDVTTVVLTNGAETVTVITGQLHCVNADGDSDDANSSTHGVVIAKPSGGGVALLHGTITANNNVTAPKGSVYIETDTDKVYVNTDGAKTWEEVLDISP